MDDIVREILNAGDEIRVVASVDIGKADRQAAEFMAILIDRFPGLSPAEMSGILINAWWWLVMIQYLQDVETK